ncbi:MAG: dephospho-CoA kinase [Treponema sp.]|nr:dephospho-CoA kinase [Treponema sp.]
MAEKLKGESLPLAPADKSSSATPSPGGKPPSPHIICLTGKMAAGKNYICSRLEKEGAVSIDLDQSVHQAIALSQNEIVRAFKNEAEQRGLKLLKEDGSLDRRALGEIVFSDKNLLARQESLVYPKLIELVNNFIEENKSRTLILNATVLYKTEELMKKCSEILFVTAPLFKRLVRAKKRDGLPLLQIIKRFKNQKNLFKEYKKMAEKYSIPIRLIKN